MLVYDVMEKIPKPVKVIIQNYADPINGTKLLRGYDPDKDCLISEFANDQKLLGEFLNLEVDIVKPVDENAIIIGVSKLML